MGHEFCCDTIPLSSLIYSDHYNNCVPLGCGCLARRPYDLFFLTWIDVPWVPDGVRDRPLQRAEIHRLFADTLDFPGFSYTLLSSNAEARSAHAAEVIERRLHCGEK